MSFEYSETFGARIRQFLRELFGSRYAAHLEEEIMRIRQDHDRTLHDRDLQISALREEKQLLQSKIVVYENTVMAHSSRMGAEVISSQKPTPTKPNFSFADIPPTKSRWEQFQDNYYAQQAKEIEADQASSLANKVEPAVRNFAGEQGAG
jgi:hypothetical protein